MTKKSWNLYPDIYDEYFDWLTKPILNEHPDYYNLLGQLFNTNYAPRVGNDIDRAADGVNLRREFADKDEWDEDEVTDDICDPCSVLEMMWALAKRMAFHTYKRGESDKTIYWFWVMICNLGLDKYPDSDYYKSSVRAILRRWQTGKYEKDGSGGLFPLKNPENLDQREVEIWYQMSAYEAENWKF